MTSLIRNVVLCLLTTELSCLLTKTAMAEGYLFTNIDVPSAVSTVATGINDFGSVVGYFNDSSGYHGYTEDRHQNISAFNVFGSFTYPSTINNFNTIVGSDYGPSGSFLKQYGTSLMLAVPGASYT